LVQCSVSFNHKRGTLRGMHHQGEPRPEEKLVRCTRGAVFDVLADLRKASPTYGRWCSYELSADNRHALYVPAGVAHGFQTLTDGAEVFYQMSVAYHAPSQRGVRFDDPTLAIRWPLPDPIVSERDRALPLLENA
jgi:dTDP-4-dehydrorhamnose 3,5-epimerase